MVEKIVEEGKVETVAGVKLINPNSNDDKVADVKLINRNSNDDKVVEVERNNHNSNDDNQAEGGEYEKNPDYLYEGGE